MDYANKIKDSLETVGDKVISAFEHGKHVHDLLANYKKEEVQLSFRNHGAHLEGLKLDTTPVGMHYILEHFDIITPVNTEQYELSVHGHVQNSLKLSLKQIKREFKSCKHHVVMECSGNGRTLMKPRFNQHVPWHLQAFGCAEWNGIRLRDVLNRAKILQSAVDIVFTGMDSGVQEGKSRYYQRAVAVDDPVVDDCFICYEMNGSPLPPQHGFPLRLISAGWYGDNSVKYLKSIELVNYKHKGYAMLSYSYVKTQFDTEFKQPVQEIRPRALMCEPGIPHFYNRNRRVQVNDEIEIVGKAWVGGGRRRYVQLVEFSSNGGETWEPVEYLEMRRGTHIPYGWQTWKTKWKPTTTGTYHLMCKATDNQDNQQKVELSSEDWNYHGMADDGVQKIEVEVVETIEYVE